MHNIHTSWRIPEFELLSSWQYVLQNGRLLLETCPRTFSVLVGSVKGGFGAHFTNFLRTVATLIGTVTGVQKTIRVHRLGPKHGGGPKQSLDIIHRPTRCDSDPPADRPDRQDRPDRPQTRLLFLCEEGLKLRILHHSEPRAVAGAGRAPRTQPVGVHLPSGHRIKEETPRSGRKANGPCCCGLHRCSWRP